MQTDSAPPAAQRATLRVIRYGVDARVYLRRTELTMNSAEPVGVVSWNVLFQSLAATCSTSLAKISIAPCFATLKTLTPSAEGALRTVKSLEALSVNDRSSGNSSNIITHESQHARQESSRTTRVERRANIIQFLRSELDTCTPIQQCVQGAFLLMEATVSINVAA